MTTTELIELLKKNERGGATGRPREVMFEVDDRIIDTDGIEVTGSGDGLISELYLSLPSAQRWIPCSERLPDFWDEKYLVSLAWGGVGAMEYKSTGFHNYGSFSPVPIETVTAWMPLPEPYKGEES